MEILGFFLLMIYFVVYGLVMLFLWLLPFVLIGGALLLGALFVRKLVLDAVREGRRE